MDSRLGEACRAGDVDALHSLLQDDSLLLDRLTAERALDTPLHVAALLGHADFAKEVLRLKPDLARDLSARGLSPLHLASAAGHISVVKEIIYGRPTLCLVKDGDGWLPIHFAAFRGRASVVAELIEACPESAHHITYRGETILHLAVKSNSLEVVELVLAAAKAAEGSSHHTLINHKDERGNTALHLGAIRRQAQTIRLLLESGLDIDVNAVNSIRLNPLDVLLESSEELGDFGLCEMILAAGGRPTKYGTGRGEGPPQSPQVLESGSHAITMPQRSTNLRLASRGRRVGIMSSSRTDAKDKTPGILMVVASLIATITFPAALSPPGGLDEKTGKAKLGDKLSAFIIMDTIGLFASLSIILLFICSVPGRKRKLTRVLAWVMWLAAFSTMSAFSVAASLLFKKSLSLSLLLRGLILILFIAVCWVSVRFIQLLLGKVGWGHNVDSNHRFSPLDTGYARKGIMNLTIIGSLIGIYTGATGEVLDEKVLPIMALIAWAFEGIGLVWLLVILVAFSIKCCKRFASNSVTVSTIEPSLIAKRIMVILIIMVTMAALHFPELGVLPFF